VLFLPSRYSFYSMRFVLVLATGVMLTLVMERWVGWLQWQWRQWGEWSGLDFVRVVASVGFAIAVLITPAIPQLFLHGQSWQVGKPESIYSYLEKTPKNTLIASLLTEVNDNIPAFVQRSVLTGDEFALPYHVEFYGEMLQRAIDLLAAQYSPDLSAVEAFIGKYGVDIWIVAEDFTAPSYLEQHDWLFTSYEKAAVVAVQQDLLQGVEPALVKVIDECASAEASGFYESGVIALTAECIKAVASAK
ncbi:MAG: hypothetical protein AAFU71_18710, partial [Cyanobacteria bacterium J06632_22]